MTQKQAKPKKPTGSKAAVKHRRLPPCTKADQAAIEAYLRALGETVDRQAREYSELAKASGNPTIVGQRDYWLAVAKGFRWARGVNRQRRCSDA